jgi:hypothetical protein
VINKVACWEVTCDTPGCDPWDDGTPHFPTEQEAIDYAIANGFVVGSRVLCEDCACDADCEATGHRWGGWSDITAYGVPYRRRYCEHCQKTETDQPIGEIAALVDAARIVNGDDPNPNQRGNQ